MLNVNVTLSYSQVKEPVENSQSDSFGLILFWDVCPWDFCFNNSAHIFHYFNHFIWLRRILINLSEITQTLLFIFCLSFFILPSWEKQSFILIIELMPQQLQQLTTETDFLCSIPETYFTPIWSQQVSVPFAASNWTDVAQSGAKPLIRGLNFVQAVPVRCQISTEIPLLMFTLDSSVMIHYSAQFLLRNQQECWTQTCWKQFTHSHEKSYE